MWFWRCGVASARWELVAASRRACSQARGGDERTVPQYANAGCVTIWAALAVEQRLQAGDTGPQRTIKQMEVPKKQRPLGERRLHKLGRPIHIASAHSRLLSSAVARAIDVRMELGQRWPSTTVSCRAELSAHSGLFAL